LRRFATYPLHQTAIRLAKSVANDQSLLFLFVELAGKDEVTETFKLGIGVFPRAKMRTQRRFLLLRVTAGSWDKIELPELDATFPLVDMFPNGKVLVVGPRCVWRSKRDYDLNGIVYDPRTGHSSRILLGDGINGVQVDDLRRIWVSYADEGVYGNFGWGRPGHHLSAPQGSCAFQNRARSFGSIR
jgi:hypothetical protein